MSDPVPPGKARRPENLLFRSRLEICRILQTLAQRRSPITAEIRNGHPFSSCLLAVDPSAGHFFIAYGVHKLINTMLMDTPEVIFTATDPQGLHFTFDGTHPEEALFGTEHAIQFALPKTLLLHNRRESPRFPVPTEISLRCIADEEGYIPFESHISDISHDGLGCLIYGPDINLEKGTVLHGCRIVLPSGEAVVTDLELRYANRVTLPDGTLANSAGFRILHKSDGHARLIRQFIQDLDKQ